MRILVTGGTGQVGRALQRLAPPGYSIVAPGSDRCDVTDFDAFIRLVADEQPDVIVHAGAMTDVDGCERDPERAFRINATGTQHVAAAAQQFGAALVYLSTNYVFDGEAAEPYHEFAERRPINVYGRSKLAGEEAVRAIAPRHYIVRTAMVYDETGRNFVNTMLRAAAERPSLTVVADQRGNPTYAGDLAAGIYRLIEQPAYGTYHLVNEGSASWYEWATEIFRLAEIETRVEPIPAAEWHRAARPPPTASSPIPPRRRSASPFRRGRTPSRAVSPGERRSSRHDHPTRRHHHPDLQRP